MTRFLPIPSSLHDKPHPLDAPGVSFPFSLIWGEAWLREMRNFPWNVFDSLIDTARELLFGKTGFIIVLAFLAISIQWSDLLALFFWSMIVLFPALTVIKAMNNAYQTKRKNPCRITFNQGQLCIQALGHFLRSKDIVIPYDQLSHVAIKTDPQSSAATVYISPKDSSIKPFPVMRAQRDITIKRAEILARLLGVPVNMPTDPATQNVLGESHA